MAEFQSGETRMVFAMVRATSELLKMPDNEADAWRQRTRDDLMCPVPRCSTPDLLAVHRETRRDGFRHKSSGGGDHKPESVFHVQAKGQIANWLRSEYPRSTTTIEKPSTPARERVADLMIESRAGHRVAFEVQYASLTIKHWKERHRSYSLDHKIADVWVFGHTGRQFKATADGILKLNELQQHIAASGAMVFWLNPITGQVATAEEVVYAGGQKYRIPACKEGAHKTSA
ncbi:competence protein CoiA [Mycetocola zhujimingii]|uniref:competence protein CoiA n=1 Tax=Mycetocola zhujimingii TaxID=2079792 RepID=UPI0013C47ED2|nr:competence protein CoiA family protein [Mycetocola zhujimingii]